MKGNKLPLWVFSLSSLISISIIRSIFEKKNFYLSNFSDRTIGIAVLEGIDIAARSNFYVELIAILIVSFFTCFKLLSNLWKTATTKLDFDDLRKDNNILFTLSTFSIFALIYHYASADKTYIDIFRIFNIIIILTLVTLVGKIIYRKTNKSFFEILNNYNFVILSFLLPNIVFFVRWILISGNFTFTNSYFKYFILIWICYWILLKMFFSFIPKRIFNIKIVSILKASVVLLLVPLSATVSNELQYSLSNISTWSIQRLSTITAGTLLVMSFLIFSFNKSKNIKFDFAKYIYLPIFVATIALFRMHINFIDINYLDMFHNGENLISTQQLFSYGKIPFINIYPTHGFSYMLGQILYSLINGYQPFAPWLWEWIVKILELVIFYFALTKITNSFFSASLIAFLPIIGIFGGQTLIYGYNKTLPTTYYLTSLLVGITIAWCLKKFSFKRAIILWASCLILAVWRVDFGIASLISAIFIIVTWTKEVKTVLTSLLASLFIGLLILIILELTTSESLLDILPQVFEFVKFQGQAQGLLQIIPSYSPLSILQYLILPGVSVFYIIYYLYSIFISTTNRISNHKSLLVYIAVFSLIMSVRSVQRQSLATIGYNPYLFILLILCIPIYIARTKNSLSRLYFVIGLLIYQLILPNSVILFKSGQLVNLYNWHSKENRVKVNSNQYKDILAFLNSNLEENQTFLDLTSSPLLYVVSNRKFVNYIIPTSYHTSEVIQNATLEKISTAHENDEIPLLIFRQEDKYANNIDGVPNEIRSYRIYEFINTNYHPVGYVDGYYIWVSNGSNLKNQSGLIKNNTIDQQYNLKKLPYIWGAFDQKKAKDNTLILESLLEKPLQLSDRPVTLNINSNFDKTSGNYLHFTIASAQEGIFTLNYGPNNDSKIEFDLIKSNKPEDYLIRVSTQFYWSNRDITSLKVSSASRAIINQAFIRKGD